MAKLIYHDLDEKGRMERGAVTWTGMYEEDGQIINTEQMPGPVVQHIIDSNKEQMANGPGKGKLGSMIGARIPIVLHHKFRREWMAGPKLWGVTWAKFLKGKLNQPEYKYLRFMKL